MKFEIGDIVKWSTPAGTKNVAIVELWNKSEPKMLLITDQDHITMDTKPVLECDCELVYRPDQEQVVREFTRKVETAKPIPNYTIVQERNT